MVAKEKKITEKNDRFFKAIDVAVLSKKINLEAVTLEGNRFPVLTLDISTINNPEKPEYSICLHIGNGLSKLYKSHDEQETRKVYNECKNALINGGLVRCSPYHLQVFDSEGKLVAKDIRL